MHLLLNVELKTTTKKIKNSSLSSKIFLSSFIFCTPAVGSHTNFYSSGAFYFLNVQSV